MKYIKWILIVFIFVLIAFFVSKNLNSVTIYLYNQEITLPSGLLVIIIFAISSIFTILLASIFGIRIWLKDWKHRKLENKTLEINNKFSEFLHLKSLHKDQQALSIIKNIIKNSDYPLYDVELAKIQSKSDSKLAIKTLETARIKYPRQAYILIELYNLLKNSNPSLALDTLLYCIALNPSAEHIKEARDLAVKLNRFDDAFVLQNQFLEFGHESNPKVFLLDLELKKILSTSTSKIEELNNFIKRNPKYSTGYFELGNELYTTNLDESHNNYLKAFNLEAKPEYADKLILIAKNINNPQKTLAICKVILNNLNTEEYYEKIFKLYLTIGLISEAEKIIDKIKDNKLLAIYYLEISEHKKALENLKETI